jgi:hypothetical protein
VTHNGYVQYGCGLCAPDSWTNFDASPTLRVQKIPVLGDLLTQGGPKFPKGVHYGDIVRGLPIAPSSCKAIYCCHVLEHLALEDLRTALLNTFSCLAPSGTFRCVIPDLQQMAVEYLASCEEQPALRFMEETRLGSAQRARSFSARLRNWAGHSRHLWMWDYRSMASELASVGFAGIRRAAYGDAADSCFHAVEDSARWDRCLGIECRKAPI